MQGIMAGAKITDVDVSKGVNRMSVSTDSDADFQAQLEEIDNAWNLKPLGEEQRWDRIETRT